MHFEVSHRSREKLDNGKRHHELHSQQIIVPGYPGQRPGGGKVAVRSP
jgi:hypothetical protein